MHGLLHWACGIREGFLEEVAYANPCCCVEGSWMKGQEEQDYTWNKKALKKVEASSREHGDAM